LERERLLINKIRHTIMPFFIVILLLLVNGCHKQIDIDKIMTGVSGATFGSSADGRGQVYTYEVDIINFNDTPIIIEEIEPKFSEIFSQIKTTSKFDFKPPNKLMEEETVKVKGEIFIDSKEVFSNEEIRKFLLGLNLKIKGIEDPIFSKTAH
jgi:hypothetical protein